MNKDPLSPEEVQEAADRFFPLFDIIHRNMPEGSKTEDSLKVMESVCNLAFKMRLEKEEASAPFGFNKKPKEESEEVTSKLGPCPGGIMVNGECCDI